MRSEGVPDVDVQARQRAVVPPFEHVAPSGFLQQAPELSHARPRCCSGTLVARDHVFDLRRQAVEREEAERVGRESKQSHWIYEGGP